VALSDLGRVLLPAASNLGRGDVLPRTGERLDLEMKKINVFGLALVAMLVFSAFAAMSASAEITLLASWLIDGAEVLTLTSVETTGEITLVNKNFLGTVEVLCNGSFDGTVGPNGEDEITEVLDLAGVKIGSGSALTAPSLDCTGDAVCSGLVEVWPDNLPWLSNLFLMEDGTILDHLFAGTGGLPGYDVKCISPNVDNLCEALATTLMTNGVSDVTGKFILGSEVAPCTLGTGELVGEGLTMTLNGKVLAVSSE
jgi:hypothetical protein